MKNLICWLDTGFNNIAIEENEKIHQNLLKVLSSKEKIIKWLNSSRTVWRKRTLEKFELFLGEEISGEVMEIGAGTAWCSALLSKKEKVTLVNTLEFDLFSIKELIPKVFEALETKSNKVQPILGSFDDIRLKENSLDYIFAMGALHHSQNLLNTYKQLYRVLKPGGKILISDMTYSNNMTLEEEFDWRESIKPCGSKRKNNGDQRFRLCQWEAYAYEAGFNIYPFTFDRTSSYKYAKKLGDEIIKNQYTYDRFDNISLFPYFAEDINKPIYDRLMLILEKPTAITYKSMSENVYQKTGV